MTNHTTPRRDGWTPRRRAAFIAALGNGARVVDAAAQAGPSVSSVYRLYRRDAAFRAAWDTAMDACFENSLVPVPGRALATLSDRALIRAIDRCERLSGWA